MFPLLAESDVADRALADTVIGSDGLLKLTSLEPCSNVRHLVPVQLDPSGVLRSRSDVAVSPFLVHVSDVIEASTEPEVIRSNTVPHITSVENPKVVGDGAVVNDPGEPVREHQHPSGFLDKHLPVSAGADGAGPQPAPVLGLLDFLPEPPHGNTQNHIHFISVV